MVKISMCQIMWMIALLLVFGMLDANSRLSMVDYPQVVDPTLHHRYHSITGCLSYLDRYVHQIIWLT